MLTSLDEIRRECIRLGTKFARDKSTEGTKVREAVTKIQVLADKMGPSDTGIPAAAQALDVFSKQYPA